MGASRRPLEHSAECTHAWAADDAIVEMAATCQPPAAVLPPPVPVSSLCQGCRPPSRGAFGALPSMLVLRCLRTFPMARADPVGGLVPREHVSDACNAGVGVTNDGEPLKGEGGPGARSQVMLENLKIARHIKVDERDADTRVDGKPAVLRGEHVGSRLGIEEAPSLDAPQVRRLTFRPLRCPLVRGPADIRIPVRAFGHPKNL